MQWLQAVDVMSGVRPTFIAAHRGAALRSKSVVVTSALLGCSRRHPVANGRNIIALRRKRSYQFHPRWGAKLRRIYNFHARSHATARRQKFVVVGGVVFGGPRRSHRCIAIRDCRRTTRRPPLRLRVENAERGPHHAEIHHYRIWRSGRVRPPPSACQKCCSRAGRDTAFTRRSEGDCRLTGAGAQSGRGPSGNSRWPIHVVGLADSRIRRDRSCRSSRGRPKKSRTSRALSCTASLRYGHWNSHADLTGRSPQPPSRQSTHLIDLRSRICQSRRKGAYDSDSMETPGCQAQHRRAPLRSWRHPTAGAAQARGPDRVRHRRRRPRLGAYRSWRASETSAKRCLARKAIQAAFSSSRVSTMRQFMPASIASAAVSVMRASFSGWGSK